MGSSSTSFVLRRLQAHKEGLAEAAVRTLRAFVQITSILRILFFFFFFLKTDHRIGFLNEDHITSIKLIELTH